MKDTKIVMVKTVPGSEYDEKPEKISVHSVKLDGDDDDEEEENASTDIITDYIGDYGLWQFFWTFLLCLFQLPCTFHIFALVFQVSFVFYV